MFVFGSAARNAVGPRCRGARWSNGAVFGAVISDVCEVVRFLGPCETAARRPAAGRTERGVRVTLDG